MADLEFLNKEREKAWARIEKLEENITEIKNNISKVKELAESRVSTDEKIARESAIKASSVAENAKIKEKEIDDIVSSVKNSISEYKSNKASISKAINKSNEIDNMYNKLKEDIEKLSILMSKIQSLQQQAESSLSNLQSLEQQVKNVYNTSNGNSNKINDLLSKSSSLKTEIEDLYDEIFGYETESGNQEQGLKFELEESYNKLKKDMDTLSEDFKSLKTTKENEINSMLSNVKEESKKLFAEIKSYLPDAVTAGLAGAFHEKKESETNQMQSDYKEFNKLIILMVAIAFIPFTVYVYWYFKQMPFVEIVKSIPNITLAVLPLYAPLIWLGVYLNKKINLSKKLIEEYAYKEAISKTVTGVSEQIKNLQNDETSQEIHENLIKLIVSASADNPGKYITGYDKCDNPLLDLISQPEKLSKLIKEVPFLENFAEQIIAMKQKKQEKKDEVEE